MCLRVPVRAEVAAARVRRAGLEVDTEVQEQRMLGQESLLLPGC